MYLQPATYILSYPTLLERYDDPLLPTLVRTESKLQRRVLLHHLKPYLMTITLKRPTGFRMWSWNERGPSPSATGCSCIISPVRCLDQEAVEDILRARLDGRIEG
jgi:hypothetical protein